MNNYYEDLDKLTDAADGNVVINVFDFDGTTFNSPNPSPELWDRKTFGKIKTETWRGGYGWYQNPLSLEDRYIDENDFNEYVVAQIEKSMKNPNAYTVLLTGRTTDYEGQIKKLTHHRGLEFDEYGLKNGKYTTMEFKQIFLRGLLEKYKPNRVEMWDDRKKHIPRFEKFLAGMMDEYPSLKDYEVHYIQNPDHGMKDPVLEKELVGLLMKDPRVGHGQQPKRFNHQNEKKKRKQRKPTFWAAYLYPEFHGKLVQAFAKDVPEEWKLYAEHMTIAFGKAKTDATKEFIANNLGKEVELTAVELGKSDEAIAVRIKSDVPSDNNISHITIAVAKDAKPVKSNAITNWEPLSEPISLRAKIGAKY